MTDGSSAPADVDDASWVKWLTRFGCVVGAVVGAISLAGALIAAAHAQYVLALLLVGVTTFCSIPYGQKLFAKKLLPRAEVDTTGTRLRPSRSVDVLAVTMMIIGLATGAAWATLGALGDVVFPFGSHYGLGYVVAFGGLAMFCACYLAMVIRNHGTAYIWLAPDEFAFAEAFFRSRGTWADVVAINDDTPVYSMGPAFTTKRAQPYARCAISITKHDGTMVAVPDGKLYAADGDALREWIRFYWQHAEYRAELADDRALERLRSWEATPGRR